MKIELVSHCYAAKLDFFATCLAAQIRSIYEHPCKNQITLSIILTKEDKATAAVVEEFKGWHENIRLHYMPLECVGRRAIGRNRVALTTNADFVWFTDVDHCFPHRMLDRLPDIEWPEEAVMIYPREILIHKTHAIGDAFTAKLKTSDFKKLLTYDDFVPKRYKMAIGGVQIVRGDFAREHGYVRDIKKWQTPTNKPFQRSKEDIAYRKFCWTKGKICRVDYPGVYRIRHSEMSENR